MTTLFTRIKSLWTTYPLARDVVMFSSLYVSAEVSQQTFLKKIWKVDPDPNYDIATIARYTVFGVILFPIVYNRWYMFLEARFPGTSKSAVAKKVLLDQFIMEPPLIAAFYTGMSAMEGKEDVTAELKAKFLPTFSVGCLYWLPAMAVNFLFLPISARVTFVGVCTFTWCNFICWFKRMEMDGTIDDQNEGDLKVFKKER